MEDQVVTINTGIGLHQALGTPSIIYHQLMTGQEVVCFRPGEQSFHTPDAGKDYIVRLAPGTPFSLTYAESESESD